MLSKCEGEFWFSEISFVACIALFVQKELAFCLNIAWVFLKHYIKMLSSTGIQCVNNFQYPMLLLILNSFFLCFNSFFLYLQTLLILFKVYHACILVYHGVPTAIFGSFHQAERSLIQLFKRDTNLMCECRKDPKRCDESRLFIGHMMWVLKPGPLFLFIFIRYLCL